METPAIEPKKIVVEYQATDNEGNPVGHPTHLEADTWEEMSEKQKQAHISAAQALARQNKAFNDLKSRKLTHKEPPAQPRYTPEEEQRIASGVLNPATAKDSIRKIGGIEEIEDRLQKAEAKAIEAQNASIAFSFMRNHLHDYYPCVGNGKVLWEALVDNNLEYTVDNLEIVFPLVFDQLAKDPKATVQNNPTIAEPNLAPSSEPNRRQPGFGMQPGVGSGTRPAPRSGNGKMTKKDVLAKRKSDPKWWKQMLSTEAGTKEINEALARG